MTTATGYIGTFVDAWARAEQRGDVTVLGALLDEGFVGVHDGETLDKTTWLARYRSGGLVHHAFCWRTIASCGDGRCSFVVGRLDQSSSYCGRNASGRSTVTLTATIRGRRWRLAGLHTSVVTRCAQ